MLAGGGAGAGLGAILGAALIPGGAGRAAFAFGLGGGSIGAHHGREIHLLHGKVIYRRTVPDQSSPTEQGKKPTAAKELHQETTGKQPASPVSYATVQTLL